MMAAVRMLRAIDGRVWLVAATFVAIEMAVSARYGFHRDDLYFIVAGRHPAAGYVDQPPLAPLLTRLATTLFGTSPSAVRVFPALAGAAVVVVSAVTARLLGGGRRAQLLTAVAIACAPVTLAAAHLANTTIYDFLAWSTAVACVVAAIVHGRSRAWLGAGVAVGLGLENKDLLLLLVAALLVGVLVAKQSRVLADPWLWGGVAIALALWAPNLVWQATHGWPERTMSQSLRAEHSAGSDYVGVLPAQFIYLGVAATPLMVAGVRRLRTAAALRVFAVAVVIVLVFVVAYIPGRPYYTDGLLPLVFAAGAVAVEQRVGVGNSLRTWFVAPVVGFIVALPVILPVLPQSAVAQIRGIHKLNYDLTETIGWPQFAGKVVQVYDSLPPATRSTASVFTSNYGEAAALDVYAKRRLPPVLSGHNTYWLWGPGRASDGTVIVVGPLERVGAHFANCRHAATWRSPHNVDNDENGDDIWVCTRPSGPWASFWSQLRRYG